MVRAGGGQGSHPETVDILCGDLPVEAPSLPGGHIPKEAESKICVRLTITNEQWARAPNCPQAAPGLGDRSVSQFVSQTHSSPWR
jgi:hypothetical protein